AAVSTALVDYDKRVQARGLEDDVQDQSLAEVNYVYREQKALVEALIRAFALRGLPRLLSEYEVVEVEQEEKWEITPAFTFMGRPDGLLRSREDGEYYALSFKTCATYDSYTEKLGRYDMQGLSELVVLNQRLGQNAVIGNQMIYPVSRRPGS